MIERNVGGAQTAIGIRETHCNSHAKSQTTGREITKKLADFASAWFYLHQPVGADKHKHQCKTCNCWLHLFSFSTGAKSPLAQFISAWVVAAVLLFLTPLFKHLPYNVLGAIVVVAVSNLFEYEQAIYLFKVGPNIVKRREVHLTL